MRPCTSPTDSSGSAAPRVAEVRSAASHCRISDSSISVHTQYACWPSRQAARMRAVSSSRRRSDMAAVRTGSRPGGSSSSSEWSRSA